MLANIKIVMKIDNHSAEQKDYTITKIGRKKIKKIKEIINFDKYIPKNMIHLGDVPNLILNLFCITLGFHFMQKII